MLQDFLGSGPLPKKYQLRDGLWMVARDVIERTHVLNHLGGIKRVSVSVRFRVMLDVLVHLRRSSASRETVTVSTDDNASMCPGCSPDRKG